MNEAFAIVVCHGCGQRNRIPRARIADDPICGGCKAALFPKVPLDVDARTFNAQVEQSPLLVLVDFWAPWCGPCRSMAAPLAQLAREHAGRLKVVKVNVDENQTLATRFSVRSIPQISFFKKGRPVDQVLGAVSKVELDRRVAALL